MLEADRSHQTRASLEHTLWLAQSSLSAETDVDRKARLTIAILSHDQEKRLSPALTRDGVGLAFSGVTKRGHVAYVFYRRVENLTSESGLDRAQVLGIVMAHEIGHLLLPNNSHAKTGLMRADWTKADLQFAQRSLLLLLFTEEQGELIRSRMAGSQRSPQETTAVLP